MDRQLDRTDEATFGAPVPTGRGPRWGIIVAVLIVVGLGAWFAWQWPSQQEMAQAVDPQAHGRAEGTAGERVPGATGGVPASDQFDARPFPLAVQTDRSTVIAYIDRQPIYVAGTRESIPDANMVVEAMTDEGKVGGGYPLYVPKDSATDRDVSARYYYVRMGPGQYVKVSQNHANR